MNNSYSRRKFVGLTGMLGLGSILSSFVPSLYDNNIEKLFSPDLKKIKSLLEQDNPAIWLFTGDSITQGAKHTNGYRCYPEIFSERVRWEMRRKRDVVINTGISGDTTGNIIKDFQQRVQQFNPDVVSLMIGTNDCAYTSITPKSFEENLGKLIDQIRALEIIPVLHTPNVILLKEDPVRNRLPEFVASIRGVAKKKELILVDHWQLWSEKGEHITAWLDDPVHPNFKGHSEIAKLLFTVLDIFDVNAFTCK
ncbi:MAG: SGNH/GDSL hydrolase family protein [Chitinophagaceae bacterium]|nr:SGNH/GDSL hydrolase family protein [Chitinophagaceae bacterium]MCW5927304.1 SGNH/GDSL hydrolase family protein [Chitinophagaceae bacterium]